MQGRTDAGIGLRARDDEPADPSLGEQRLEVGALERVAVALVHHRLGGSGLELGNELPARSIRREVVVGVLHPDHRGPHGPGPLHQGGDVGDHTGAVVSVGDDVVLHVDHEQRGAGPVVQTGHGSSFGRGAVRTRAASSKARASYRHDTRPTGGTDVTAGSTSPKRAEPEVSGRGRGRGECHSSPARLRTVGGRCRRHRGPWGKTGGGEPHCFGVSTMVQPDSRQSPTKMSNLTKFLRYPVVGVTRGSKTLQRDRHPVTSSAGHAALERRAVMLGLTCPTC